MAYMREKPVYNSNFKYEKTAVKIADAMERGDLKTFSIHFFRMTNALYEIKSDPVASRNRKIMNSAQLAFEQFEEFCTFYKAKVEVENEEYVETLKTICWVNDSFENWDLVIKNYQAVLDIEMSKNMKGAAETYRLYSSFLGAHRYIEEDIKLAKKFQKYLEDQNLCDKEADAYIDTLSTKAEYYYVKEKYQQSMEMHFKSSKYLDKIQGYRTPIPIQKAQTYQKIAECYKMLRNPTMAVKVVEKKVFPITETWKDSQNAVLFDLHCMGLYMIGDVLSSEDCEKAIQAFEDLLNFLKSNPSFYSANVHPRPTLIIIKQFEEASHRFLQALKRNIKPDVFKPHNNDKETLFLANVMHESKQYQAALNLFNHGAKVSKGCQDDPDFLFKRGKACLELDKMDQAIDDFTKAIGCAEPIEFSKFEMYETLGDAYAKLDYVEEQLEAYQTAQKMEYDKPMIRRLSRKLLKCFLKLKMYQDFDQLCDHFFNHLHQRKDDVKIDAWDAYGRASFHCSNHRVADHYLSKCLEQTRNEKSIRRAYILMYYANNSRIYEKNIDILSIFDEALELMESLRDHKEYKQLKSALTLNKCVFWGKETQKPEITKFFNVEKFGKITTGIFHSLVISDVAQFLKMLTKHYKKSPKQGQVQNYVNSISILQHFKSRLG